MVKENESKMVWEWGTRDEIRFLDRIKSGKSVVIRRDKGLTRTEIKGILSGYALGIKRRVNWDNIDHVQVERWLIVNGYMKKIKSLPKIEQPALSCSGSGEQIINA